MDNDKVVEIAVDLKCFKPGVDGEGRTPLVVLTWEKEDDATGQTSHFMISQVEGRASYISLKQLLNNNLTLYNLAMQMYEECALKLRRINYPPLDLVFNHESLSNLKSEKDKIFELLNSFLENSSKSKTKTVYKITIETGRVDPCEQFSTVSPQKKKEKRQLMKEVQRRLQDADKRLDDQQQVIDSQLDDRESSVDAMLVEISELSKRVLDDNNAIPSVEHAQQIPVTKDANEDETDHKSVRNEDIYEPKKCEQKDQETNDTSYRDKTTIMHKTVDAQENEGSGPTLDSAEKTNKKGIGQSGTDIVSPDRPKLSARVNKKAPAFVSSPRKPPMDPPYHLSQGKATEVSGCQFNVLGDEPCTDFDEELPDDAEDFDDLYDDGASYLDSSYVSSPGKFRRRAGDQKTGMYYFEFKSGSKVYRLPVLATYTYTPASTATATSPKSLTYPSSSDAPVTQMGPLNFKEEREAKEEWGAFQRRKEMIWNTPEGQENLRSWLLALIGESPFWSRLSVSMEEALMQDTSSVPRAREGLDTILCLDTSGSMGGPHLEKMKKILLEFIDGVENMAKTYDLHENIAIVTFGGRAKVIQHLTNDYHRLRQSVYALTAGGPGPLHEGIVVSMACLQHSGLVSIDSKFKLPPRLVIMCDGFPTSEVPETNTDSGNISVHGTTYILGALGELNHRQLACAMPHPIVFVQIGYNPCIPCLESIATASGGSIIGVDAFPDLSRFHRNNMIAAEALMYLRNYGAKETIEKCDGREFLSKFAPGITSAEAIPVYGILKERFVHLAYTNKEAIQSFCNIHEEPELPPLGSRVVRGQDWNWTNQDSEGTGTVINHAPNQMMYVQWDNGVINIYRHGHKGKYDVVVVHDQPRVSYDEYPHIGCQVERGPQWRGIYGDQDGGQGNYGVIIRTDVQGRFLVRWNNGNIFDYRCYTFYKYDVILRDPLAVMLETTAPAVSPVHDGTQEAIPDGEQVSYEWQREDGRKGWETYSEDETMKLNKAYARNPLGTCLIRRNGTSFRVSFKQLEERSMDKSKVKVRRIPCRR